MEDFFNTDNTNPTFENKVHLRLFKRTAKKSTTQIEGLPNTIDFKALSKVWAKKFSCNATIKLPEDETHEEGPVIILQGDHRDGLKAYLLKEKIVLNEKNIVIHG